MWFGVWNELRAISTRCDYLCGNHDDNDNHDQHTIPNTRPPPPQWAIGRLQTTTPGTNANSTGERRDRAGRKRRWRAVASGMFFFPFFLFFLLYLLASRRPLPSPTPSRRVHPHYRLLDASKRNYHHLDASKRVHHHYQNTQQRQTGPETILGPLVFFLYVLFLFSCFSTY